MKCPHCKSAGNITGTMKFCPSCGKEIPEFYTREEVDEMVADLRATEHVVRQGIVECMDLIRANKANTEYFRRLRDWVIDPKDLPPDHP